MSQHDFGIDNQTFPSFRADLNAALAALASMNSGSSPPPALFPYMLWGDGSVSQLKIRSVDNASWHVWGQISNGRFELVNPIAIGKTYLEGGSAVGLGAGNYFLRIGGGSDESGLSVALDYSSLQARTNGSASPLKINPLGGEVHIGGLTLLGTSYPSPWDGTSGPGINLGQDGGIGSASNGVSLLLARLATDGDIAQLRRGTNFVGSISVTSSAASFNTASDYRLKENVAPMSGALNRLMELRPVRFNFRATPGVTVDGFLAHEAAEVVPEAIHGAKDATDSAGNPIYQGIDQAKIVPLLVAALQDLATAHEALLARVAVLEGAGSP